MYMYMYMYMYIYIYIYRFPEGLSVSDILANRS